MLNALDNAVLKIRSVPDMTIQDNLHLKSYNEWIPGKIEAFFPFRADLKHLTIDNLCLVSVHSALGFGPVVHG